MDRYSLSNYSRYRGWDDYTQKSRLPSERGLVNLENGFISFFKEKYFINKSFVELLYELADPNSEVTNQMIANWIIKYIYALYYPNSVNARIELSQIHNMINIFIGRNTPSIRNNFPNETQKIINIERQFRLLLDISKSIEIIKEIIFSYKKQSTQFIGVDLGCGTGLMTLAQYIAALRNKHDDISIYAVDWNIDAIDRFKSIQKSIFGESTTLLYTCCSNLMENEYYQFLKQQPISYIYLELIPAPRQRWNNDLILKVFDYLYTELRIDQLNNTHFIFNQIETYSFETDTTYLLNKENRYGYDFDETTRNDLANSYPRKIELNGEMVYLLDIGLENDKYLTDDGLLNMTPRW